MSTGSELYDLLAKTNATLNPNNTITLRFNDGSSYTTGVIKDGPELSPADKAMEEAKEASTISQAAMEEAGKAAVAAGNAEQSASEAAASATNAENFASEAQQSASTASTAATNAETSASDAATSASNAATNAQAAATSASAAEGSAQTAASEASEAKTQATEAKTQATAATSYANGALTSLSTVQDVIGVLDWAQKNAQYSLTADTDIVPGKTYWTRSGSGTEADPYTYAPVVSPVKTQLSNYYEISGVDEAMADYINTHLALVSEGGANDGLYVLSDGSGWKVRIANDGVYIIDPQGNTATKYKDAVTLGNDDGSQSYQYLDYHSLQMIDKEGDTYFYVSDLRDKQTGRATIKEAFTGDGETTGYTVIFYPYSTGTCSVTVNGTEVEFLRNYKVFTLSDAPAAGASIIITYQTSDAAAKAFTFGSRNTANSIGAHSFAAGRYVTASGYASHAENIQTVASGNYSHAEGGYSEASGNYSHAEGHSTASGEYSHAEGYGAQATGKYSHAEGYTTSSITPLIASGISSHAEGKSVASGNYSHAEGYARAQGDYSHAEGYNVTASGDHSHAEGDFSSASGENSHAEGLGTSASGDYSHSQNEGTTAASESQTAIGRYNEVDSNNLYALIVGNGTNNNRSNAATVDWRGNVWAGGTVTAEDMTDTEVSDFVDGLSGSGSTLLDFIYPVGVYFETSDASFNPNTAMGGTWNKETVFGDGKLLFNNDSAEISQATITLSESITNFDFITVCYKDNDNKYHSVNLSNPVNKEFGLIASWGDGPNYLYHKTGLWRIETTTLTKKWEYEYAISTTPNVTRTQKDAFAITQVIAYKTMYRWHRTA